MWLSHRHRATVEGQKTPRVSLTSSGHDTDTVSDRGKLHHKRKSTQKQTTAKTGQRWHKHADSNNWEQYYLIVIQQSPKNKMEWGLMGLFSVQPAVTLPARLDISSMLFWPSHNSTHHLRTSLSEPVFENVFFPHPPNRTRNIQAELKLKTTPTILLRVVVSVSGARITVYLLTHQRQINRRNYWHREEREEKNRDREHSTTHVWSQACDTITSKQGHWDGLADPSNPHSRVMRGMK